MRVRSASRLILSLLIISAATTGCAARTVTTAPVEASPADAYLAAPVQSGWQRSVGTSQGVVLVFEAASKASSSAGVPYRFVVFNASDTTRSWDDVLFIVRGLRADGAGGLALAGALPIGEPGGHVGLPSLSLRPGESTTHDGVMSERLGSDPHRTLLVATFRADGPAGVDVVAPELEVGFE